MSTKETNSWQEGEASSGEAAGEKGSQPSSNVKRNCGKWWWLYFLLLIIIVVVIVIPIVFVAIKNLAQGELNKATVNVDSQTITAPGENSFDLVLNTTIDGNSGHAATVETFNQSFYMLDTKIPFMYATMPGFNNEPATGQTGAAQVSTQVNISAPMTRIANMSEFSRYTSLMFNNATFSIGVMGHTHLVLSELPKYSVLYDKVVTMKGFNKFQGLKIVNVQIPPLVTQPDGATMTASVILPNPSVIEAQFGNVTWDLYSNNDYLGYAVLQYVDYKPGNNLVNMRGFLNATLAQERIQNKLLPVDIKGNSSLNLGGQHIPYFEAAWKDIMFSYTLNLTSGS